MGQYAVSVDEDFGGFPSGGKILESAELDPGDFDGDRGFIVEVLESDSADAEDGRDVLMNVAGVRSVEPL